MAKRKITATAKNESQRLQISTTIEMDGLDKGGWDMDQQRLRIKRLKNALYDLLSEQGFHYDEIKIK